MDWRQSAIPEEKERAEVAEADTVVQRQGPERMENERPSATPTWKVENRTLVSPGRGAELLTDAKFQDFKLHIEFNCAPGSNSGVYLRGRYELQIEDDPEPEGPTKIGRASC